MSIEQNAITVKFFHINGEVILDKVVPFKKFRIMKELSLLLKEKLIESKEDVDIERTIDFLNENNRCLKVRSILVVDDDEILRDLYESHIGRFCHYVDVYESATKALEDFKSNPLKYDYILSDNIMPEMKGDRFSDLIKEIKPDIPIYIITGDADSVSPESFNNSVSGVIKKPIDANQLRSFIGEGKVDKFWDKEDKVA
jgi:CheY-like chemotaxis protein